MSKIILKKVSGFTLVEMTVVLVIIGLLLAGLLVPLREGIKQERRAETVDSLKTIEEALYGFTVVNGRLPCPDCRVLGNPVCNDGQEDFAAAPNDNQCLVDANLGVVGDALSGNIPWATLNNPQSDAWGSWFTYYVYDESADTVGSGTPGLNPGGCVGAGETLSTIDMCGEGNFRVIDASDDAGCAAVVNNVSLNVFAVVISHGANITRSGAGLAGTGLIDNPPLCSELENLDGDNTFVSSNFLNPGDPGDTPATAPNPLGIDDQVIWISPHVLKSKLVQAGRLP